MFYQLGIHVDVDHSKALYYFTHASDRGIQMSHVIVGDLLLYGNPNIRNPEKSVEYFERAARVEDPEGYYRMFEVYFMGIGVEEDVVRSLQFLEKSASLNHLPAILKMADVYEFGVYRQIRKRNPEAVQKNSKARVPGSIIDMEIKHLREISRKYRNVAHIEEQGGSVDHASLHDLIANGEFDDDDDDERTKTIERLKFQADLQIVADLEAIKDRNDFPDTREDQVGECFVDLENLVETDEAAFECVVEPDLGRSLEIYSAAAEMNDIQSMFMVAYKTEFGIGCERDFVEAIRLYSQAAAEGHTYARFRLGVFTLEGLLGPPDYRDAFRMIRPAAVAKIPNAIHYVGKCYFEGWAVYRDYEKAFDHFVRAAASGVTDAQFHLGLCFLNGLGVEPDLKKAVQLFVAASKKNHLESLKQLEHCYKNGLGVATDSAKAKHYADLGKREIAAVEAATAMAMLQLGAETTQEAKPQINFDYDPDRFATQAPKLDREQVQRDVAKLAVAAKIPVRGEELTTVRAKSFLAQVGSKFGSKAAYSDFRSTVVTSKRRYHTATNAVRPFSAFVRPANALMRPSSAVVRPVVSMMRSCVWMLRK